MPRWLRRFLIVLTIGGGFVGLVLGLPQLLWAARTDSQRWAEIAVFAPLYIFAIYLGLRLAEGHKPFWGLVFYFALQVPWIDCPGFSYRFYTGAFWAVMYTESGQTWLGLIGWFQQLRISSSAPLAIGINVIALLIVFGLIIAKFVSENEDDKVHAQSVGQPLTPATKD